MLKLFGRLLAIDDPEMLVLLKLEASIAIGTDRFDEADGVGKAGATVASVIHLVEFQRHVDEAVLALVTAEQEALVGRHAWKLVGVPEKDVLALRSAQVRVAEEVVDQIPGAKQLAVHRLEVAIA